MDPSRPLPAWSLSRVGLRCGGCNQVLPAAMPVRRLLTGRFRCAPCAKRLFDEEPPAKLAELDAVLTEAVKAPAPRPLQALVNGARRPDFKRRAGGDT